MVCVADLRIEAAHDSAYADRRVVGITDEKVLRAVNVRASPSSVVSCSPSLASRMRNPPTTEGVEVIRMVRLVQFEHHVVAHVHDVADRAHAGCGEAIRHPVR